MQLDHIAIIISKEENLEFYKKLGFVEKTRFKRNYDIVVFMENEGTTLEIFVDPRHPERINNPEANGLRHIGLKVNNFNEIINEFECESIKIDFFGNRFTFIKDLDGQPIEIKEIKKL